MKRLPSAILIFAIVLASYVAITHKTTVKPQAAKPVVKLTVEAPPKTLKATLKVTDTAVNFQQVAQGPTITKGTIVEKPYVEPKNTPKDHCLLVPHQELDDLFSPAPPQTHSVLTKSTVAPETCSREQHDSGTSPQNRNFNLRGFVPSFGGFGGGGFHL